MNLMLAEISKVQFTVTAYVVGIGLILGYGVWLWVQSNKGKAWDQEDGGKP